MRGLHRLCGVSMIDKAEDVLRNWPGDFVQRGQDPMAWSYQAEILKSAARAVLQKAKEDRTTGVIAERWVDAVYKSLVGTALENLLKAIMVRTTRVSLEKIKEYIKSPVSSSTTTFGRYMLTTMPDCKMW